MTIRTLLAEVARRPEISLGVALGLGALAGTGAIPLPSFRLPTRAPIPAAPAAPSAAPPSQAAAARPLVDPASVY